MKRKLSIIAVGVALGTVSFLVAAAYQQTVNYITDLIVMEQRDHYVQMRTHVDRLRTVMVRVESDVERISDKKPLTGEDREQIARDLRTLEEIGAQIERRKIYYDEDNTVHMFFAPEPSIGALFMQTYNTPLYIDRFVRVMEQGVFMPKISVEQKDLINKACDALQQEVESL